MKIKKDDREAIQKEVEKWAKSSKARVIEKGGDSLGIAKQDWELEIVIEDGWAYVHGNGSLSGISTNIEDTSELGDAIKRLQKAKENN